MFVSNMKILTLNSKQNVSLSTPTSTQQQFVQMGEALGAGGIGIANTPTSEEYVSHNDGGGSTQITTSKGRDLHLKHSGTNKCKYNSHGSSNGNKIQQSQHQQQKYHHSSINNKNKKQHYNNNNSSTSLSRKKFYQQQQNALHQTIQYHYKQQKQLQYLPTSPHTSEQQTQPTKVPTTTTVNSITTCNNNNSIFVKNQNYTIEHNAKSDTNTDNSPLTISDDCICGAFENGGCEKLSSSTEMQNQQLPHHSVESNIHLKLSAVTTSSNNISVLKEISNNSDSGVPSQTAVPPSCSCWSNISSLSSQTKIGNLKTNKGGKFSVLANRTNLQDFVAAAFAHKCNCQMHSTVAAVPPHASNSVSKKKTFWKSSNTRAGCIGVDTISSCSISPKFSNDKEDVTDKIGTKNDACSCRRHLRDIAELPDEKNIQKYQKADNTTVLPNKVPTVVAKASTVANPLPSGSNINISDISSPLVSSVWQQQSTNSTLTVETVKTQNDDCNKVETSSSTDHGNVDSVPSMGGGVSTHVSGRGPLSPNSYTLDFLHSVGVQITGGSNQVSVDDPLESGNNNTISAGAPVQNGNRAAVNSTQRAAHSYLGMTNARQPRNMVVGGSGNNSNHYQHHQQHYHHHPSQLTIASFLQKDLLGESNSGPIASSSGGSAMGGSGNYSEQRGNIQQQHYTRHNQHARYHSNFFQTPHYQQQQTHSTYSGAHGYAHSVGGSVGAEFSRMAPNVGSQRPIYGSFHNYHSECSSGNKLLGHHQMNHQQHQYSQLQNNKSETENNIYSKKVHCSSSASSCSSSSSSSNSSYGPHQKHQQQTIQRQQKPSSTLNSAIETLPSKYSNQHLNQRLGHHHRGGHYHGHNYHSHHNHHGHHHHHHAHPNTPTTPQHQNYYNLTYVSTDGNIDNQNSTISTTTSRDCSPTPQSSEQAPTPMPTSTHSPKGLENSSCKATMLTSLPQNLNQENYSRSSNTHNSTAPQFHQYQQQKYLNKQFLVPLTVTVSSPSPAAPPLAKQQLPMGPHNIICCSQLDEATTAAAAAAAKTVIIAGNEYDSDTSSTAVISSEQVEKYQSVKSLSTTQQSSLDCHSQPGTPAEVGPSTTLLYSPLDYAHAANVAAHTFPAPKIGSTGVQHQQMLNQEQQAFKSAPNSTGTVLPQIYRNSGVISLLNLPSHSPNRCGGSSSKFLGDEYHQQHQPRHLYLTHHQSSTEHLNVVSLSLTTNSNSSNSSSGYWSPSHQCNFVYHQLPSGSTEFVTSNTPSCGSSSLSVSPCLTEQGDELKNELGNPYQHIASSAGSSPSSCLNEQLVGNHFTSSMADCSSVSSSSANSTVSAQAASCSFGTSVESNTKNGSTQLLAPQQQRSIAQQQQTCSSSPAILNCSSSALSNTFRVRNGVGRQNQAIMTPNNSVDGSGSTSSVPQQTFPQIFSHQQSLPSVPLAHNLLYNNPQAHHLRPINTAAMHDFFIHTPPDRFLARAHLIEAKETPTFLLNSSKWDNLSQGIWKKFVCSQQTEETFKQKMHLWRFLYLFIKNSYPRYGLYLVGSTISGFGSDTSDVDMCLVSRSAPSIDPRMEALFNLTILRDCLNKSGEFEHFNLIEAKVPILRFRDRVHQLEVDLNFNNCVGIKNTHLLYCYSQLDWRLRPLVLVTKLWAQHHNINNAKNMTISSYSLVLMVIHFLQYAVNPPVLPCLHDMFPDKFPLLRSNDFGYVDMNETLGPYESKNSKTIGELFLNFLEYYSCFDYTQFAISVRTGGTLPINVCRVAKSIKNDPHQWKELCIEEPFDLTNTARSVYDYETFERVKAVFISSWHALQESLDLNSVFLPTTELSATLSSSDVAGDGRSVTYLENTAENLAQAFSNTQISSNTVADNRTPVSTTEENTVLRSSVKQITNYRDTKLADAQCHKDNLYDQNISGASTNSTANSSTLSSSYNTKDVIRRDNIVTAITS